MIVGMMSKHTGLEPSVLMKALKHLDYSEYGGAPLLGVKGVCIIGHGSSNANAIKNGIRVAAEWANSGLNQQIEQEIHAKRANHIAAE